MAPEGFTNAKTVFRHVVKCTCLPLFLRHVSTQRCCTDPLYWISTTVCVCIYQRNVLADRPRHSSIVPLYRKTYVYTLYTITMAINVVYYTRNTRTNSKASHSFPAVNGSINCAPITPYSREH